MYFSYKEIVAIHQLFILTIIYEVKSSHNNTIDNTICETSVCQQNSDYLLSTMDFTIDPCENFYKFVCGQKFDFLREFTKNIGTVRTMLTNFELTSIKMLKTEPRSSDIQPINQMKQFYSSCLEVTRKDFDKWNETIGKIVSELGGSPITSSTWSEKDFLWYDVVAKMQRFYNILIFFGVDIIANNNKKHRSLVPQILFPKPAFTMAEIKDGLSENLFIKNYTKFAKQIFRIFSDASPNRPNNTERENEEILEDVSELRVKFLKILHLLELDDPEYRLFTIKELQQLADQIMKENKIKWLDFFKTIFQYTDTTVSLDTKFLVGNLEKLRKILNLVNATDKKTLASFIMTSFFDFLYGRLTGAFFIYRENNRKTNEIPCFYITTKLMPTAFSYQYLIENKNDAIVERMENMIKLVKAAVRNRLSSTTIFDEQTKKSALKKLDKMTSYPGYLDFMINSSYLLDEYKNFTMGDNFFNNFNNLNVAHRLQLFKLLISNDLETFFGLWTGLPIRLNASYEPTANAFYILYTLMHFPAFQLGRPDAINFGFIGQIIGHEIFHGFDNMGKNYDDDGILDNWWTKSSGNAFANKIQCHVDFYESFELDEFKNTSESNKRINGTRCLNENIADIEGHTAAFEAYKQFYKTQGDQRLPGKMSQFSPQQLFFIGGANFYCNPYENKTFHNQLADVHAPHNYRVRGITANTPYFNQVFNCAGKCRRKCLVFN